MREFIAYHCFYGTLEHMGHIVRNSAGVMEHPPLPAAATYRAGGRHSPTRSRPNFPDPGFKTFPKIIPDFSAIESRVRPPLGSKLAPSNCQGWKKPRNEKEGSVAGTKSSQEIANSALVAQWHRTRGNVVLQNGDKTFPTTATSSQWLKPSRVQKKNYVPHVRLSGHVSAYSA